MVDASPAPTRSRPRRGGRRTASILSAAAVGLAVAWTSPGLPLGRAGPPQDVGAPSPAGWVSPGRASPVFWWVWAEVHDVLGVDAWRALDVGWMPARARADLRAVGPTWRYEDPFLLAGLWRLGLERERVLELVAAHDGEAVWPLATPGAPSPFARERDGRLLAAPRLERWWRAQPVSEATERLHGKLAATWAMAVASKDVGLAAAVVEASEERLGREAVEDRASDALGLVRETVAAWEARTGRDPRAFGGAVPVALMERVGVPDGVDLEPLVAAARRGAAALANEAIPLPHPYDLHLLVLRLERLRDRGPTRLPIVGTVRDAQGRPVPAAWVEVERFPHRGSSIPAWRTDVHGRFRIDDVPRGPARLSVTLGAWSSSATKHRVETQAGAGAVDIVVDPGLQLVLRIDGYVPGPVPEARGARVTWEEPDGGRAWRWAPVRDDGWVRFVALPPDRELEVWADGDVGRWLVRARGLKPGDAEQRLERAEVKDLAGVVRGSPAFLERSDPQARGPLREHLTVEVYAHPGFRVATARVRSDGTFRVVGLPVGTYVVSVELYHGDFGHPARTQRVEAGTTDLVIDLEGRGDGRR